jgi:hypothetical protein
MKYYRNRTDADLETMLTEHRTKMGKLERALSGARDTRHSLRRALKRRGFDVNELEFPGFAVLCARVGMEPIAPEAPSAAVVAAMAERQPDQVRQ